MKHTFQSLLQYVEVMIQCVNLGVCRHYIHGIAVVVVKLLINTRICSDTNSQRREASNESTREKMNNFVDADAIFEVLLWFR